MKVKILTDFSHNGQKFFTDDQVTVDGATGDYFCRAGWAEDLAGVVPTAKPGPSEVVLEVQDLVVTQQTVVGA